MQTKPSGRQRFLTGIFQFLWAELKTMNWAKIKSLFKITIGYIRMKYFKPKKQIKKLELEKKEQQRLLRETSYRLSS